MLEAVIKSDIKLILGTCLEQRSTDAKSRLCLCFRTFRVGVLCIADGYWVIFKCLSYQQLSLLVPLATEASVFPGHTTNKTSRPKDTNTALPDFDPRL